MSAAVTVAAIRKEMVDLVPQLRAFARSLCRDATRADDLVQEALVRALSNLGQFTPGTNLKAWLFTIVRNEYYTFLRRGRFETLDDREGALPEPTVPPEHEGELQLRDLNRALGQLSPDQREALILVTASGFSYEEAASICNCAVGTIKSRVGRAREQLGRLLEGTAPMDNLDGTRQEAPRPAPP